MAPRKGKKRGPQSKQMSDEETVAASPSINTTSTATVQETEMKKQQVEIVEDEKKEDVELEDNVEEMETEEEEDDIEGVVDGKEVSVAGENESGDSEEEGNESGSDYDDEDENADFSMYMQMEPHKYKKKQSRIEIFVGGLDRKAVEEDLIKVFGAFGEIKSARIVKHPITHKSKGYAFISFATSEQAKKVLAELKDGVEVKGKHAGISASQDSDTIYMGNICKSWTKDQVLETLKGYGIEQIEDIFLPEDPKSEGKIRGFAYMEFGAHSDAMAAFQRLGKPDAVFGRNRSAKVAFVPSMHPSEEALSQVKTVYVEGLTDSWNEGKLKQLCEQYGQVEKVQLSRDLVNVRREDFGFVSFTSRENALACVAGINDAQVEDGDVTVRANLAKPQYKGRLGKSARGGYRVQKDGEKIEENGKAKAKDGTISKGAKGKGKGKGKGKASIELRSAGGGKKPQGSIVERQGATAASGEKGHPAQGRKRDGKSRNSGPSERPSKKPRGHVRGRPTNGLRSQAKSFHSRQGRQAHSYGRAPAVHSDPYARGYTASGSSHQDHVYGAAADMEPHAGYLRPASVSHGRYLHDYELRRADGYGTQGRSATYVGYGTQGRGATSYVGGSVLPHSYAPGYSRYAAYESGSAGGHVYPSSEPYVYQRPYY